MTLSLFEDSIFKRFDHPPKLHVALRPVQTPCALQKNERGRKTELLSHHVATRRPKASTANSWLAHTMAQFTLNNSLDPYSPSGQHTIVLNPT